MIFVSPTIPVGLWSSLARYYYAIHKKIFQYSKSFKTTRNQVMVSTKAQLLWLKKQSDSNLTALHILQQHGGCQCQQAPLLDAATLSSCQNAHKLCAENAWIKTKTKASNMGYQEFNIFVQLRSIVLSMAGHLQPIQELRELDCLDTVSHVGFQMF